MDDVTSQLVQETFGFAVRVKEAQWRHSAFGPVRMSQISHLQMMHNKPVKSFPKPNGPLCVGRRVYLVPVTSQTHYKENHKRDGDFESRF